MGKSPSEQIETQCRYGTMAVPNEHDLISKSLLEYGEWAQLEIEDLAQFIRNGNTVLDVGACLGTHSLAFSHFVGESGKVVSFEPNPDSFDFLRINTKPNNNIKTFQLALGCADGTLAFCSRDKSNFGAAHASKTHSESDIEVPLRRLDDVWSEKVDFIKVDIEGEEYNFLQGAQSVIENNKPLIFLEANSLENSYKILDWARSSGYSVYGALTRAFNNNNFKSSNQNLFGDSMECAILLINNERVNELAKLLRKLKFPNISCLDDLALLLLHKPQYPFEVFQGSSVALQFGINYPTPALVSALAERDSRITSLIQANEALRKSFSWRVTAPLRTVRLTANKIRAISPARSLPKRLVRALFRRVRNKYAQLRGSKNFPNVTRYRPSAPQWSQFEAIAERRKALHATAAAVVDVIIPVYRGYADTFACIASVLQSENTTAFDLIVLDDYSPEPDITRDLERLEQMGLIKLFKNQTNLGFVATVNRGMALHPDRDVLLLNSDTLVFGNWLDRLKAHTGEDVATVTPFTNNGTICSYPIFGHDNPQELDIGFDRLDQLAASINKGKSVEVPTGVGFCLYITRRSLDETGLFDHETFGKGYGEENDFCMRAAIQGYRNLHALDVFVFHSGETSFADSASESKRNALKKLKNKHFDYDEMIGTFYREDPARYARIALDVARALGRTPVSTVLFISHIWGGGIQRYIDDRAAHMRQTGRDLVLAVPDTQGTTLARLLSFNGAYHPIKTATVDLAAEPEMLRQLFDDLKIESIEMHSTAGWSSSLVSALPELSQKCGIPYKVMLHDYIPICPRINLVNETGLYCGEKGLTQCAKCLRASGSDAYNVHQDLVGNGNLSIRYWRSLYGDLLSRAAEILAPSDDTATRIKNYFKWLNIKVTPHPEEAAQTFKPPLPLHNAETVKIVVIGAIGRLKGFDVLCDCARDAKERKLPLQYTVIGYTCDDAAAKKEAISITGRYDEAEIYDLLMREQAQIVFLPSVCPETYSYTFSTAKAAGLPTAVFDIGAQAERLRSAKIAGLFLPLDMAKQPDLINDELLRFWNSVAGQKDEPVTTPQSPFSLPRDVPAR